MTRILLVGGGGREHALAWRVKHDNPALDLIAAPGNPGIALHARCVNVAATNINDLASLARAERVDAVIVGPEVPLAEGLVDRLSLDGIPAFGPTAAAAMLETSKAFAKDIMRDGGVPTARASTHRDAASATRAAHARGAPVVIKASGLAAGKGVVVADTLADAERAIDDMLGARTLGDAGAEVLVEECMRGEELSLFVLTDGRDGVPLVGAQDHKRLLVGDQGPNTGGMGAYAPVTIGTADVVERVMETVVRPTLAVMHHRRTPFRGVLYVGLMLTEQGPRVVEFNCRFGDPETQAVLPLLTGSLVDACMAIARGERIENIPSLSWDGRYAVTTVLAADGYPGNVRSGDTITLADARDDVLVFHAGTARRDDGTLVTAGGRVLAVTGIGATFERARTASQNAAGDIHFAGRQFRTDIGWRESSRRA